jgi:hypothetical protein
MLLLREREQGGDEHGGDGDAEQLGGSDLGAL